MLLGVACGTSSRQTCVPTLAHAMVLMLAAVHFGYTMAYGGAAAPTFPSLLLPTTADWQRRWFERIPYLAAIPGPAVTGVALHYAGRRALMFALALFALITRATFVPVGLSAGARAGPAPFAWVLAHRAFAGLSVGAFSALTPLYLAEIAPRAVASFFGALNQLGIAVGFTVCYLVSAMGGWLALLAVGCAWPLLLCALVCVVPESPAAAATRAATLRTVARDLAQPEVVTELRRWCALMFFQQMSGVNAFVLNLQTLLSDTRDSELDIRFGEAPWDEGAPLATLGALAQVIACLIGAVLMPHVKQRMVWSLSLAGVALTNLAYALMQALLPRSPEQNWAVFLVIFLFLLSYGFGVGPIPWFGVPTTDTRDLPLSIRAVVMAAVACLNWVLVSLVMLLVEKLTDNGLQWELHLIFAVVSAVGVVLSQSTIGFCYVPVPPDEVPTIADPKYLYTLTGEAATE
jgi:MFS family permease